jgi:hypothetical protein
MNKPRILRIETYPGSEYNWQNPVKTDVSECVFWMTSLPILKICDRTSFCPSEWFDRLSPGCTLRAPVRANWSELNPPSHPIDRSLKRPCALTGRRRPHKRRLDSPGDSSQLSVILIPPKFTWFALPWGLFDSHCPEVYLILITLKFPWFSLPWRLLDSHDAEVSLIFTSSRVSFILIDLAVPSPLLTRACGGVFSRRSDTGFVSRSAAPCHPALAAHYCCPNSQRPTLCVVA